MKVCRFSALLLFLLLAGALPPALAMLPDPAGVDVASGSAREGSSRELLRVISGLERLGDVVVYRVQLAANDLQGGLLARADSFKAALGIEPGKIAVLYPDLGEPYRGVFAKIIEGIEEQSRVPVTSFAVGGKLSAQDIVNQLKRQDIKVVIALGRQGLKAASGLEREFGVVAGGVISVPEGDAPGLSVVSLAPDPGLLFERLKRLMPAARRVLVVYDPRQNAWLMRLAREAARAQGLELQAVEAHDLKSAVLAYQEILLASDPKKDALWLPQDSTTVEEGSVLPLVLEGAWSRNLALFSSNVTHVKRGALFALYPNNLALGRQLATSAQGLGSSTLPGVVPLKELLLAVNVRTANHLGFQLSSLRQRADLLFPEQ